MQQIGIITDSHSGISQEQARELGIRVLPMPFYIGEECFYEDVSLSRAKGNGNAGRQTYGESDK